MIVADASVLVVALADDGPDGDQARSWLRGERLAVPELADLEVASVLRRQMKAGTLDARRAPHRPLLPRCWELRNNLTIYDAAYVALAEASPAFTRAIRDRPACDTRSGSSNDACWSSWDHATIALARCPLQLDDGSVRNSHRPSSEGTFRVERARMHPINAVDRG